MASKLTMALIPGNNTNKTGVIHPVFFCRSSLAIHSIKLFDTPQFQPNKYLIATQQKKKTGIAKIHKPHQADFFVFKGPA